MSNDELVAETEKRKAIEATVKTLEEYVRTVDATLLPTLFVAYKAPDGKLMIKSQIGVCDPKGDGKRSCAKRVSELVGDLFPTPVDERAPRKPKTPKPETPKPENNKGKK
jgi:hypothetical protein